MECNRIINLRSRTRQLRKRKWKAAPNLTFESLSPSTLNDFQSKMKRLNNRSSAEEMMDYLEEFDVEKQLLHLPNEILSKIAMYLDITAIGRITSTCQRFHSIVDENLFWKKIFKLTYPQWDKTALRLAHSDNWKRQVGLNHTKGIFYRVLGSGTNKAATRHLAKISDTAAAFGLKKLCCTRNHVFVLDFASCLHVYRSRFERVPGVNDYVYKKVEWHKEFAQNVIDMTTDPRYDSSHRRYVYVLTQSEGMRNRRDQVVIGSNDQPSVGFNKQGWPISGDKIDVFDERTCRRVFNMTFDPEMRFVSMKLTSFSSQQKTLYIVTDNGKVYSLHLFESTLLNLGSEGMQVTLKSASKNIGDKVARVETSVGLAGLITERGKLFVTAQRKSELADVFGRDIATKVSIPQPVQHVAKVVSCSVGDRHLGFVDEYNRAFLMGNNRYGQLGTGDRMDRHSPVQVLGSHTVRLIDCGLNHTLAVVEVGDTCEMMGTGSGNNGRLPGKPRGSLEFTTLSIEVPWSVRQIDAHKDSIFMLTCHDCEDQFEYKKRNSIEHDHFTQSLALKTQQELLMELRKSRDLTEKMKIIEVMAKHVGRGLAGSPSPMLLNSTNFGNVFQHLANGINMPQVRNDAVEPSNSQQQMTDLAILHTAIELVRLETESMELDRRILDSIQQQQPAPSAQQQH